MPHIALIITAFVGSIAGTLLAVVLFLGTAVRNTPQAQCEVSEIEPLRRSTSHPDTNTAGTAARRLASES